MGSCAAPSAKGDDKFITTDYLQQCQIMSLVTDLPAIFDQFSEARQKGFLTVMDLKERGIPLVGTY
ncbi:hypothetical protein NY763_08435, partial [Escherichia coli]|nr:hypothetical protein [Escherichia coli]